MVAYLSASLCCFCIFLRVSESAFQRIITHREGRREFLQALQLSHYVWFLVCGSQDDSSLPSLPSLYKSSNGPISCIEALLVLRDDGIAVKTPKCRFESGLGRNRTKHDTQLGGHTTLLAIQLMQLENLLAPSRQCLDPHLARHATER